ncbi:MAG: RnfABCDGE type electron transport complex subunit B [Euryarchaeota archaeon]|nr:RnfABCDGE type electron transport complex subunit B [Euryarchaeota archaeon]
MIEAVIVMGVLGIVFGAGLAYASGKLEVPVDPRVERITELLPGGNCGACGFPACRILAEAVVEDHHLINNCKICDEESWLKICSILGIKFGKKKIALVACSYDSVDKFEYEGVKTCATAALIMGGFRACEYACLGFGDCVHACTFNAIEKRGYKYFVDTRKCIGCGACMEACPRDLMRYIDADAKVLVRCNSLDKGKIVAKICEEGCIACKQCEKVCEREAIKVENNLAVIDYELCNGCGACMEACKRGTIVPIFPAEKAVDSTLKATRTEKKSG